MSQHQKIAMQKYGIQVICFENVSRWTNFNVRNRECRGGRSFAFIIVESRWHSGDRITERTCSRTLRSSAIPLLFQPFTRTDFSRRGFRFSAPSVWNSIPAVRHLSSATLRLFSNLDLKLFYSLRLSLNTDPTCRQRLNLRPYGAIEIRLLLLLL